MKPESLLESVVTLVVMVIAVGLLYVFMALVA